MTAAAPRISIVLSFRDAGPALDDALTSLRWQTETDWELIAIDDGSRDGSAERPGLHGDQRILVIRHEFSAGLAVRLNEGVALARGRYIARMDADDVAFPQRLQLQADFLDHHPEVDLLASSVLMIDNRGEPLGVVVSPATHERIVSRAALNFPMPHPTWMGRADWFRAHGYDERALKAQDQHLLYRTHRNSRFAAIEAPLLAYRYDRLSVRKTTVGRYHFLRALWSHGSARDIALGTTLHALAAARDLLAMVFGLDREVMRGRVSAIPDTLRGDWNELKRQLEAARS
ncbi:MAG: glycosyltransferase family 2 protein [Methyloversatilis sp.]|nr:glycosyltransferase family 2 protein [Methyloversatilis sp.]